MLSELPEEDDEVQIVGSEFLEMNFFHDRIALRRYSTMLIVFLLLSNKLLSFHPQRPLKNDRIIQDVADPLYAHCKLHLDKSIAKKKVHKFKLLVYIYISH